jgi:hypothetical protein
VLPRRRSLHPISNGLPAGDRYIRPSSPGQ